jgi:hypothetical protein
MDAYTLGLAGLVVVLLIVLWMRRPRRPRTLDLSKSVEEQVAGFVARDADLLGVLRQRGVDLNVPRHIDLHFLADTEQLARDLMRSLPAAFPHGKLELDGPLQTRGSAPFWSVTCIVQAPISAIVAREAVERRVRLAAAAGALHDGWGTPLGQPQPDGGRVEGP